jgi:threonine aldolase
LGIVDLRSDTMNQPTPEMRHAMSQAEVGDDVYGEDPSVNRLEALAAARLGKEAAVYVASGTMANLVSSLAYCQRGDEILVGDESHIFHNEGPAIAALGAARIRTVPTGARGMLDPDLVDASIRSSGNYQPRTAMVALENTHNRSGGSVLDPAEVGAVAEVAHRRGVPLYVDGARIFNAAVALGVYIAELVSEADTVSFCLSKCLGSPAGSLVCGSRETIAEARRYKRMLGGGMRQIGILAAAGIVALETMVERIADDHAHARRLAEGLATLPGIALDPSTVQTNIVLFEVTDHSATEFMQALREQGVLINYQGGRKVRMITHPGIGPDQVDTALNAVETVIRRPEAARR